MSFWGMLLQIKNGKPFWKTERYLTIEIEKEILIMNEETKELLTTIETLESKNNEIKESIGENK